VSIPDWWEALLLGLASWRIFQLLAYDEILERPRRYVTRLGPKWEKEGDPIPADYRIALANWLTCPYCAGFWVALAWWGAWQAWPHGSVVAAVPFALSAIVVAGHSLLSSDSSV
jgi:hypothetical protein